MQPFFDGMSSFFNIFKIVMGEKILNLSVFEMWAATIPLLVKIVIIFVVVVIINNNNNNINNVYLFISFFPHKIFDFKMFSLKISSLYIKEKCQKNKF